MVKQYFEAKTIDEATQSALSKLNVSSNDVIVNKLEEGTKGLLGIGGKKARIEVILLSDVLKYGKEFLNNIVNNMGFECKIEAFKKDGYINYKIYSDQNNVLIGRNGSTLQSLQFMLKQAILNQTNTYVGVTLDIGGYKDKKANRLETLAHRVSRTVAKTKIPAKLDSMNAYERRIIHTYLAEDKYVYTTSEGEEPNRYVVIKPKE